MNHRPWPTRIFDMSRFARPRRPATESGFTMVEVLVAASVALLVLLAATDLLVNLMGKTADIQRKEQGRMLAYQVAERAKAYGCGLVYGSEADLSTRGANCKNGLSSEAGDQTFGTCGAPASPAPTRVLGDVAMCWKDGQRKYNVAMTTRWDYTDVSYYATACDLPPDVKLPDLLVRTIVVSDPNVAGPTGEIAKIELREAAPPKPPGANDTLQKTGSGQRTVNFMISGSTYEIIRTGTGACTLFPRLPVVL